jgi:hypothetical protein
MLASNEYIVVALKFIYECTGSGKWAIASLRKLEYSAATSTYSVYNTHGLNPRVQFGFCHAVWGGVG